jgi:PAS domain S-box-containing protein
MNDGISETPTDEAAFRWGRLLILLVGYGVASLAALVMIGWQFGIASVVHIHPTIVPMPFNTALGFLLTALGLVAWLKHCHRLSAGLGLVVFLLGTATLVQYLFHIDIGIDELFMRHVIVVETSHPGRMAPNTAFCFVLFGVSYLVSAITGRKRGVHSVITLLSALVVGLALVALAGYLLRFEPTYGWSALTRMAAHTSVGFLLCGVGLWAMAMAATARSFKVSFPSPVGLCGFVTTILLWQGFESSAQSDLRVRATLACDTLVVGIQSAIDREHRALQRVVERWEVRGGTPFGEWSADAGRYVEDIAALGAVVWIDEDHQVRWSAPAALEGVISGVIADESIDVIETRRSFERSGVQPHWYSQGPAPDGASTLLVYYPFSGAFEAGGALVAVYDVGRLMQGLLVVSLSEGWHVHIVDGDVSLYTDAASPGSAVVAESDVHTPFGSWSLALFPSPVLVSASTSKLGGFLVLGGLAFSALLTFSRYQTRRARMSLMAIGIAHRDIADQKKQLAEAKQQLQDILDNTGAIIYAKKLDGAYLLVNRRYESLFGYSIDDLRHKTDYDIFPQEVAHAIRVNELVVVEKGHSIEIEEVIPQVDGMHHYISTKFPLKDTEGKTYGVAGVSTDITELNRRKAAELQRAIDELSRRKAQLDEFTYMASHDLQEPLRKLISFSQLLRTDAGGGLTEAAERDIEFIVAAARRMRSLVQDLLNLSRVGRNPLQVLAVDLDNCIDLALDALSPRIKETRAEIIHGELPEVFGDAKLLSLLFRNLLQNALTFVPAGRAPRIELLCERREGEDVFTVRDNGIGLKSEYAEQIFAPFKRLHGRDVYEGTGIGLSVCRRIVERHGGRIWVESEEGVGSDFKFTLGLAREDATCDAGRVEEPLCSL